MRVYLSVFLLVTLPGGAFGRTAVPAERPGRDLKTLSLEELMQIDVTTVSRSSERRIDAPAAVSVITGEDSNWRSSGAICCTTGTRSSRAAPYSRGTFSARSCSE